MNVNEEFQKRISGNRVLRLCKSLKSYSVRQAYLNNHIA